MEETPVDPLAADERLVAFGAAVRQSRKLLRLSLRELAQGVGLSASYLSSIECGRNPTTGRPPQPSVGAVDRLCDILKLERAAIFSRGLHRHDHHPGCEHVLLFRLDDRRDGLQEISRRMTNGMVGHWLCIVDPNTEPEPTEDFHAWSWPYRSGPYPGDYLEVERITEALALRAVDLKDRMGSDSYGVIIADCSSVMRWVVNPDAEVDYEEEWCQRSGGALAAVLGGEPAVNMCVYHQKDFEALSQRVDRLNSVLRLIDTHERVAAVLQDGMIVEGSQAVLEILRENRPDSVSSAAWRTISSALASRQTERAMPHLHAKPVPAGPVTSA